LPTIENVTTLYPSGKNLINPDIKKFSWFEWKKLHERKTSYMKEKQVTWKKNELHEGKKKLHETKTLFILWFEFFLTPNTYRKITLFTNRF
jgi:hypothetical protein